MKRFSLAVACGILVVSGLGCAYYNTFYFARKYYAHAEKSVKTAGSDKLPPDAIKAYDDAIKQCTKVITYHANSRWVDDAIYLMGACYYGKHEYESALKKFDELMANYPKSDRVPWAHYMSGLCQYRRRNYADMEASFHWVLQKEPHFARRDDILFTMARAAEDQRDRPEAIRRYRELIRQFPHSDRAGEGLLRIGDLYFDAGDTDSAYVSYRELARTTHDDKLYQEGQIKASDALVRMGEPQQAIDLLQPLIPADNAPPSADDWPARARIHLAQAYNAVHQPEKALVNLRFVTAHYPTSSLAAEAQFQIGYTHEVYLDAPDSARTAYDAVARYGAQSVFREQAAARSRDLQQIQSLSKAAAGDSTSSGEERQAEAALKIAEVYLLSQNRVAEAEKKYREVIELYPGSRMAPRAAYALAWIHLRKTAAVLDSVRRRESAAGDSAGALAGAAAADGARRSGARDSAFVEFKNVIRDYPASRQARGALDLLAEEGADTTGLHAMLLETEPDTLETEADTLETAPEPDSIEATQSSPFTPNMSPREEAFSRIPQDSLVVRPDSTAPLSGPPRRPPRPGFPAQPALSDSLRGVAPPGAKVEP
jgi:TolA-binding protein